jgi:hypothetical protein
MNIPQLTAEASLYRFGTHYRTRSRTSVVGSSSRTIRTAQGESGVQGDTGDDDDGDGGEIINVSGVAPIIQCPDGYEQVGDTCIPHAPTPPVPVSGGHGPQPKPKPKPRQTGNGLNGGNYNPTRGAPCCSNTSMGMLNYIQSGTYSLNPYTHDWTCCHSKSDCDPCVTKNGKSQFCEDGSCPPGGGLDI